MRIPNKVVPVIRLATIFAVLAACLAFFAFLWVGSGGTIPVVTQTGYRVSVDIPRVSNLVGGSSVMAAGVPIGKVVGVVVNGDQAQVTLELDSGPHPLHRGATVTVRYKTLLEETFIQVQDGPGAEVPSGGQLPAGAGKPDVELNDVLSSLDQPTRQAFASAIRMLGLGTQGSAQSISAALTGLGELGRQGKSALDALAAQSGQLRQLTSDAATLVAALDTRQGEIVQLINAADQVTQVTANDSGDIQSVMRQLPGLLSAAQSASSALTTLSGALAPVAQNLAAAAPDLSTALQQLPRTAADLRALLPSLDGVLTAAPPTLTRVPAVAGAAERLIPHVRAALGDLDPMLAYLGPYAKDFAGWFANNNDAFGALLPDGNYAVRLQPVINEQSVAGLPLNTNLVPLLNRTNPYPGPNAGANPVPGFTGQYPHVQKAGN